MSFGFDHAIIGVQELEQAVEDFRKVGFTVTYGGEHASGTTQNAVIPFRDGTYLELMAPTGKPTLEDAGSMDFAPLLGRQEGFVGYALRSPALESDSAGLRERGITVGDIHDGRRKRKDGVELHWRMALYEADYGPLIFIQDMTPRDLRIPTKESVVKHTNGAVGIKTVLHVTDDVDKFRNHMRAVLNLPDEHAHNSNTFTVGDVRLNVTSPSTELLRKHYDTYGTSVWRIVLRGPSDTHRHLDGDKLHGADLIIVGDNV